MNGIISKGFCFLISKTLGSLLDPMSWFWYRFSIDKENVHVGRAFRAWTVTKQAGICSKKKSLQLLLHPLGKVPELISHGLEAGLTGKHPAVMTGYCRSGPLVPELLCSFNMFLFLRCSELMPPWVSELRLPGVSEMRSPAVSEPMPIAVCICATSFGDSEPTPRDVHCNWRLSNVRWMKYIFRWHN